LTSGTAYELIDAADDNNIFSTSMNELNKEFDILNYIA